MRAWACLIVLLLCTEASARELSAQDKKMIYNLYSLTLLSELCTEDYVFDEDVLSYFLTNARLDVSEEEGKPITDAAASDAFKFIRRVGKKNTVRPCIPSSVARIMPTSC